MPPAARAGDGGGRRPQEAVVTPLPSNRVARPRRFDFISPVFNSAQSSPVSQVLRWRLFPGYPFGHGAPPRFPASRGESKERLKVSLGGIAAPFR